MSIVATADLSDRQAAFVESLLEGCTPQVAQTVARYESPAAYVYLLKTPAVLHAVQVGVQRLLQIDAPVNLRILRKIRDDDAAPARVRADIGLQLMKLAGHVAPTHRDDKPQKALSDMTQAELLEHIDRNQAAIEKAEAELMAKAKDITPGDSVGHSVPTGGAAAPKPLNYLD